MCAAREELVGERLVPVVDEAARELDVCGQPRDVHELVAREPAELVVHARAAGGLGARAEPRHEAVHGEVEVGVVVLDGVVEPGGAKLAAELLGELAAQGLDGRLALLDLSAGQLPAALVGAVRAMRREDAAVPVDDARRHVDRSSC